jgi:hypothetical protein
VHIQEPIQRSDICLQITNKLGKIRHMGSQQQNLGMHVMHLGCHAEHELHLALKPLLEYLAEIWLTDGRDTARPPVSETEISR